MPNWDPPKTSKMWEFLEHVVALFNPCIRSIKILEGDEYPSQSLVLLLLSMIEHKAIDMQQERMFFTITEKLTITLGIKSGDEESLIYVMCSQLITGVTNLWNTLPQDVLIASLLDPRLKDLRHVDEANRKEGWNCLVEEYKILKNKKGPEPPAKKKAVGDGPSPVASWEDLFGFWDCKAKTSGEVKYCFVCVLNFLATYISTRWNCL